MSQDIFNEIEQTSSSVLELQDNYYAWQRVISSYEKLQDYAPDQQDSIQVTGLTAEKNAEKLAQAWMTADKDLREMEALYSGFSTDLNRLLTEKEDIITVENQEYLLSEIEQNYGVKPIPNNMKKVEDTLKVVEDTFEELELRTITLSHIVEDRYGLETPQSIRDQQDPTYINEEEYPSVDLQFQQALDISRSD